MNVTRRARDLKALLDLRVGPGALLLPKTIQRIDLTFAAKSYDGHMGARKVWREYLPRLKYHNPGVTMTVTRHDDHEGPSQLTIRYAGEVLPSSTSPSNAESVHNDKMPDDSYETLESSDQSIDSVTWSTDRVSKASATDDAPDLPTERKAQTSMSEVADKAAKQTEMSSSKSRPDSVDLKGKNVKVLNMQHKISADILREFITATRANEYKPTEGEKLEIEASKEDLQRRAIDRARQKRITDAQRQEARLLEQAKGSLG